MMTGFFYMSVLTAIGMGFIGFQLVAACDRLGFSGIDFFGMALLLFCGPLLVLSLNLISGGRETFKFLGAALTTFFLFLFFNAGAMHSIIGAGGFMNPLYALVTLIFMIIIFLTAGMAVWNFAQGRILETSSLPWLALAMTVAVFIGAWGGQWKYESKRNAWYRAFASREGTEEQPHDFTFPAEPVPPKGSILFGVQLTLPLGLPGAAEFSDDSWSDFEAEASALASSGATYAIIRAYFRTFANGLPGVSAPQPRKNSESPFSTDIVRDDRVVSVVRNMGLGLVFVDTPMTIPGEDGSRRTFDSFTAAHTGAVKIMVRRYTPDILVVTGEPHPGILIGVSGEVTREEWTLHVSDLAFGVRAFSPGTRVASAISIESLIAAWTKEAPGATPSDPDAPVSPVPPAETVIDPCVTAAMSDSFDYIAIRVFFREQAEALLKLSARDDMRKFMKKVIIIETWNGWAIAGPRSGERDAMWVSGVAGIARKAGFAMVGFSPFGNFFKGRYYNDFGTPGRSQEFSAAFSEVIKETGISRSGVSK